MKNMHLVSAFVLISMAALGAGCNLQYAANPSGPIVQPTFDPTGTWQAGNAVNATTSADYLVGTRSTEAVCTNEACTTSGDYNANQVQAASLYNFSTADGTPAVLESASNVTVYYLGGSYVYINIRGTGFSNGTDPRSNPDFIRVAANTQGYSTVQIYPEPGAAVQVNYLGSRGCAYLYSTSLSLGFSSNNQLRGYVSTRYTFANTDLADLSANPSCDAIFASYQADFASGQSSLQDQGVFYLMATLARNSTTFEPALDVRFVDSVAAVQFDHYFEATRRSTIPSDGNSNRAVAQINGDFIRSKTLSPNLMASMLPINLAKIRNVTVRPNLNRPVIRRSR